jgi:hypothetical protein
MQVLPNPNNGQFTIQCGQLNAQACEIKIYNNIGKTIYSSTENILTDGNIIVELDDVETGLYFIILRTGETVLQEKMIIK